MKGPRSIMVGNEKRVDLDRKLDHFLSLFLWTVRHRGRAFVILRIALAMIGIVLLATVFSKQRAIKNLLETRSSTGRRDGSYVHCVRDGLDASCVFHDICYKPQTEQFLYFVPQNELPPRIAVHKSGSIIVPAAFSEPLAYIQRDEGLENIAGIQPLILREAIPNNATYVSAPVSVFLASFWPENFGHALGDDVFAVYSVASVFRLLRNDIQVVFPKGGSCRDRGSSERGCEHHKELFGIFTTRPLLLLGDVDRESTELLCFPTLLAGTSHLGMGWSGTRWDDFMDFFLASAGLRGILPHRQRIIIVDKVKGRRLTLGLEDAAAHLRKIFDVDVDIVPIADYEILEQIRLLRKYTVMFTPCGGVSFSAAFMAPGSSVIFTGYWNPDTEKPEHMEYFIWKHHAQIHHFYYNVYFEESTVNIPGDVQLPVSQLTSFRDYADVRIVPGRLARHVYDALLSAEVTFGWVDSFSRSHLDTIMEHDDSK